MGAGEEGCGTEVGERKTQQLRRIICNVKHVIFLFSREVKCRVVNQKTPQCTVLTERAKRGETLSESLFLSGGAVAPSTKLR